MQESRPRKGGVRCCQAGEVGMMSGFDIEGNPTITRPRSHWPKCIKTELSRSAHKKPNFDSTSAILLSVLLGGVSVRAPATPRNLRSSTAAIRWLQLPTFTCNSVPSGQFVRYAEAQMFLVPQSVRCTGACARCARPCPGS